MLAISPNFNIRNDRRNYSPVSYCKRTTNLAMTADSVHFKGYSPEKQNRVLIKKIVELIKDTKIRKIAILAHSSPDIDAVGSMVALKTMIKSVTRNKQVDAFTMDPLFSSVQTIDPNRDITIINEINPRITLPTGKNIESIKNRFGKYDLVIVVDTAKKELMDPELRAAIFDTARNTVSIDHHKINEVESSVEHNFADINLRDTTLGSASQLIMQLAKPLGLTIKKIKSSISDAILAGILKDTGMLSHILSNLVFSDIKTLRKTSDYNKVVEMLNKTDPEQERLAKSVLRKQVRSSANRKIKYFVVDQAQNPAITKETIEMVFDKIKAKGTKYYFCIVTDSEHPKIPTTAHIRCEGASLDNLIKDIGCVGHDYACILRKENMPPKDMATLILQKLTEIISPNH